MQLSKLITIVLVCSALIACSGAQQEADTEKPMERFDMKKTYVVASPYSGQLLKNGEPIANQKLINELRWNGQDSPTLRELSTDDNGSFSVPLFEVDLELGMFDEFSGKSRLYLSGDVEDGRPNYIMSIARFNNEAGAEFGQPPINMRCELTAETQGFDLPTGLGRSKCTWDNMYESELLK